MQALFEILFPVVAVIAAGYVAARAGMLSSGATKTLADLTFLLLTPPLLFRAMAKTSFDTLSFGAPTAYFGAAIPMFVLIAVWRMKIGSGAPSAAVYALAATFSNTVMLGIPLVTLAYGQAGLSALLTIVALHSLILLTSATIVLELGRALRSESGESRRPLAALALAVKSALLHPVILPIIAGVLWSLLHWPLPGPIDAALNLLGVAAPPLCLVLLGASLAQFGLRAGLRGAIEFAVLKNLVHPAAVFAIGRYVLHLDPLPLSVATLAAAMPIGNNVYLFAQRYEVERAAVSAGVVVSTLLCAVTLPFLLTVLR